MVSSINGSEFEIVDGVLQEYFGVSEEVVVPDGVTTIGENAFWNAAIKAVKLPMGLKIIEEGAFLGCRDLRETTIPETVTSIGTDAFGGCGIRQLVLPPKLIKISEDAFSDSDLEEIIIPKSVRTIGRHAFCRCRQLKRVVLPENLKRIEHGAFKDCTALEEINLPQRVFLDSSVFDGCTKFMDDDGFIVIDGSLYNSPGIYKSFKVRLPEGIRIIKGFSIDIRRDLDGVIWARDRDELRRAREEKVGSVIEIPSSVEKIECPAFLGDVKEIISHSHAPFLPLSLDCDKLIKITVPEGTEISENVFGYYDKDVARFKKLTICYSSSDD